MRPGRLTLAPLLLAGALLWPAEALGHCDGMDGPVVKAAREALKTGNVDLVLIWVQKDDEAEIKEAFERTLSVRKLGPEAMELADTHFFEPLVRIHRAGEGAPYTGLKPAGRDLGPAIPAADKAIQDGSVEPLAKLLVDAVQAGLRERFKQVVAAKGYAKDDVEAGRRYVQACVVFVHYVERIYESAKDAVHGHFAEEGEAAKHGEGKEEEGRREEGKHEGH